MPNPRGKNGSTVTGNYQTRETVSVRECRENQTLLRNWRPYELPKPQPKRR